MIKQVLPSCANYEILHASLRTQYLRWALDDPVSNEWPFVGKVAVYDNTNETLTPY